MIQQRYTRGNIVLLVLLLVLCLPVGMLFWCRLSGGGKGLLIGTALFLAPLLLLAIWVGLVSYANAHPEFGEHADRVAWLPATASDISFYRSYSYTAYEFKIGEDEFKAQANPGWKFTEITEPEHITRYNYPVELQKYQAANPEYNRVAYEAFVHTTTARITRGLVSRQRRSNGGGYHAVYDRDTGTAYIQANPR